MMTGVPQYRIYKGESRYVCHDRDLQNVLRWQDFDWVSLSNRYNFRKSYLLLVYKRDLSEVQRERAKVRPLAATTLPEMKDTHMVPAVGTETDRLLRTADVMLEVHRTVTGDRVRAALRHIRFEFVHTIVLMPAHSKSCAPRATSVAPPC